MRTAYLAAEASVGLPPQCCVVAVSPLLQQLLLRLVALPQPFPLGGAEERLVQVLLDELRTLEMAPLHLPRPSDPRLRRVVDALLLAPEDDRVVRGSVDVRVLGVASVSQSRGVDDVPRFDRRGWRP